jgi:hypothetical protein
MSNSQTSTEDQKEISNASNRVVVVAARFALEEYREYSTYICQPNRTFQDCVRMAFYTKNKIDRRIPKILGKIEAISRDEIETRTNLSDIDRARLRTLLKIMKPERSEEWSKKKFKIVFLSPQGSPDTLVLPHEVINNLASGSGLQHDS